MTSKSASTTRRAPPATRPTAKAEAGSRPPTTVSDAVSAVAGLGGTSTNVFPSPGSPSVARIGGSGTILSFARARSLQRTIGNQATRAVLGTSHPVASATKKAMTPSGLRGTTSLRTSESVSTPAIQREFGDYFKSFGYLTRRAITKSQVLLIQHNPEYEKIKVGKEKLKEEFNTALTKPLADDGMALLEEMETNAALETSLTAVKNSQIANMDREIQDFEDKKSAAESKLTNSRLKSTQAEHEDVGFFARRKLEEEASEVAEEALQDAEEAVAALARATTIWTSDELRPHKVNYLTPDMAGQAQIINEDAAQLSKVAKTLEGGIPPIVSSEPKGGAALVDGATIALQATDTSGAGVSTAVEAGTLDKDSKDVIDAGTATTAAGLIVNIKETYEAVGNWKDKPTEAKATFMAAGTTAAAAGSIISLIGAKAPGLSIVENGLKAIASAIAIAKAYKGMTFFREKKKTVKETVLGIQAGTGFFGGLGGHESGAAKAQDFKGSQDPTEKQAGEDYFELKNLQDIKEKNIARGVLNFIGSAVQVAGDIMTLAGVTAGAGLATAAAGKGLGVAADLVRRAKRKLRPEHEAEKMAKYNSTVKWTAQKLIAASAAQQAAADKTVAGQEVKDAVELAEMAGYPVKEMVAAPDPRHFAETFVNILKDRDGG